MGTDGTSDLRLRHRHLLAELGGCALRTSEIDPLLQEACRIAAEGMGTRFCKVLQLLPEEGKLLVRAGVGWRDGVVGHVKLDADDGSPAGHALRTGEPVISNDLARESRFRTPALLVEHGIERAMNVIIQGDCAPFGVLEVDSRHPGGFSEDDISFLQAAANLVGVAIGRGRREEELREALRARDLLVREADHRIKNSLQLVASLLALQRSKVADPAAAAALTEAIARVRAVGESHRALHRSADLTTVDLARMLGDLATHVGQLVASARVECQAEEGVEIDAERAIPLGLVVSELLTNAARHAYGGGEGGVVWVRAATVDGQVEVTVSDEGVGMDPEAPRTESLGTTIVRALTRQIGAELILSSAPGCGTTVTLRLPRKA